MSRARRAAAVLALSAGTLAYQILLVRVFAIEQFHHFATMAVGVAMLGVGAAGTTFSLANIRGRVVADRWFVRSALLTALALVVSPLAAGMMPVDPTTLAWDHRGWLRLAWLYLVLAAPFALGALAVLAALARSLDQPGTVYGASLAGSGLGAALALAPLWVLSPGRAVALPAVIAAVGAALTAPAAHRPRGMLAGAGAVAATAVWLALGPGQGELNLLPYKGLPQILAYPDARILSERHSPVGWVVAVDAPAFRHVPGLSLAYRGAFPPQTAVFVDGDLAGALSRWDPGSDVLLDWHPGSLPWVVGPRQRVLVLGGAAGLAVATASRAGTAEVTAVALQPEVVRLAALSHAGGGESGTRIRWAVGAARGHAARAGEQFDLVALGLLAGGPGGGAGALAEDYDHTVEAYVGYLNLLAPDGVLAVTVWTAEPPRGELRLVLTAGEALRRLGPARMDRGIVVVRSWGTMTVLVKPDGFLDAELAALEAWGRDRWFDLEWRPGLAAPGLRYNLVERPVVFEAARATVSGPGEVERFVAAYPFDIRPATDLRPYPHHFTGFRAIRWLLERRRGDWLPFAEWGHLALLVTLIQSGLLAVVLMAVPAMLRAGRPRGPSPARLVGYFAAIGVGFLAAEIAAIQQFTLLLGHPVYAVAGVLAGLLVASGLGSLLSDRWPARQARVVAALLTAVLAGYAVVLLPVVQWLQPAPTIARAAAALLLLAPAALLMGMPFPLGVRAVAGPDPSRVAWAWAANGFASVVTAPIAALVALDLGHGGVLWVAAGAYAVAAAVSSGRWRVKGGTEQGAR